MMETITIKESWKAPFVGPTMKQMIKRVFWLSSFCFTAIGVIAFFCILLGNPFPKGLLQGLGMLGISLLGGPLFMLCLFVVVYPMLLLLSIPIIIAPNTYEFSVGEGRFRMNKNDHTKMDLPLSELISYTFVVVKPYILVEGNSLGTTLKMEYMKKGKKAEKKINLGYMFDKDIIILREFMAKAMAYKEEMPLEQVSDNI